MKLFRKLSYVITLILIPFIIFSSCKNNTTKNNILKVRLNEVTRSIFYAPLYAAISQGYFKAEGIELDISIGQGADKTIQQVLSGNDDVGFCGPEQVIYIYNQNRDDYPILFAQLTQKDGSFLVSRKTDTNFKWESLKGKTIIGGRPGGVPEMALEYILKEHGLEPNKDVNVITNIAFSAAAGAFQGGTGDYVTLFEPTASILEQQNSGKIVSSIGESSGIIPYTCFFATKSYINKNSDIIQKFTNAIHKGQLWIKNHNNDDIAKSIKSFFPGTDEKLISKVISNYKEINAYAESPVLKETDLSRLMDIIQSYDPNLIKTRPPFSKIVNNNFSENSIQIIKLP